ncbi:preprotein translocase subunit SecY [Ignicoccus hospitalis]|uniref:Protein translocase subunit SecY n=1 Tax=Ignicoccus hospitalis (strain KIN4/I / DSM 18386 / JCM 14125) TaxID=453591 RepID=A8ABS3_IGNH4|nr:preprotein translocase subunit SecY [Ignicoccus hospitalis]ABU82375.1 protein translocase subunit secY/sec61 alpha [Ignicoccus hospitalis KIN4/I]
MQDLGRKALEVLAEIGTYVPAVPRPKRKINLYKRLTWTALALVAYLMMSNIPLPGVSVQTSFNLLLMNIVFAANAGTLMQLGIGPIVTAGLVLQLLVGAKIIDLDLTDPEDKKLFTLAQKGFAVVLAVFEAIGLVLSGSLWTTVTPDGVVVYNPPPAPVIVLDMLLLAGATILVIIMDEMIQKGYGLGSGISLFIAASVVSGIAWEFAGWFSQAGQLIWAGLVPAALKCGLASVILGNPLGAPKVPGTQVVCDGRRVPVGAMPDLIGFLATVVMIAAIAYLSSVKIQVPLVVKEMRGMRIKIPLNLLYVTNIPVLLAAIIFANIQTVASHAPGSPLSAVAYYLTPPRGLLAFIHEPLRMFTYGIALTALSVAFGYLWVELAGLDPKTQARNLIESGLHVPGARSDPRHLEKILAKYIYPLTILSSIIVALLVIVADIFGAYGTGTGLLLATMILQQYYTMLTYERAIETYPLLRKVLGE